jgi:predicted kinase
MEVVIFIGIPASGKSTFYKERLINTHVRLNLDMLKTRHREKILFRASLEAKQPVVIDNTNPTREDRARYIVPAKKHNASIVGYYFDCTLQDCIRRNAKRSGSGRIPVPGIRSAWSKLEIPSYDEGFDELYSVERREGMQFSVRLLPRHE